MSHFAINLTIVATALLVHAIVAGLLLTHPSVRRRPSRRAFLVGAIVAILLLDLPLVYLKILYKEWNPLLLDQVIAAVGRPWIFLQWNVLLLGIGLMIDRLIRMMTPYARRVLSRGATRTNDDDNATMINPFRPPVAAAAPSTTEPARQPAGSSHGLILPRRRFVRTSALALAGVAANGVMLLAANDQDEFVIERRKIRLPNLPDALKGTTIVLLSDIHSSTFMPRERMERYAKAINGLKPDLIVMPGDFVNSKLKEVYPFGEAFSTLTAPLGVYGVTGNHDYYTRAIEHVVSEVEQAGITILKNENVTITKNGASLKLLGVDEESIWEVRDYLKKDHSATGAVESLIHGVGEDETTILLCHKPYPFEEYAALGVDLMLSGHTHGGQIVIGRADALNVSVASLASTYIAGTYKARSNDTAQMYVSRGIGTAGIPLRVNCPPEITHIMLV